MPFQIQKLLKVEFLVYGQMHVRKTGQNVRLWDAILNQNFFKNILEYSNHLWPGYVNKLHPKIFYPPIEESRQADPLKRGGSPESKATKEQIKQEEHKFFTMLVIIFM